MQHRTLFLTTADETKYGTSIYSSILHFLQLKTLEDPNSMHFIARKDLSLMSPHITPAFFSLNKNGIREVEYIFIPNHKTRP